MTRIMNDSLVRRGFHWVVNKVSCEASQQRVMSYASLHQHGRCHYCSSAALMPGLIERTALRDTTVKTSTAIGRRSLPSYTKHGFQENTQGNMNGNADIKIAKMTLGDLRTTVEWTRMGNWNPGNRDAEAFFTADENGFFMAKTAGGDPVASISAVRYGEDYGFLGLNISNPGEHYNGYSKYTLKYAMRHLDGRVIGTDAMASRLSIGIRSGFAIAHKTVGVGGVIVPEALSPASFPTGGAGDHVVIKDLTQVRTDAIMLYDREHVPAERYRFLRGWLTTPGHVVKVGTVGNEIRGYGVLRPCFEGSRIGPLFAESVDVADMLIRALVAGLSPGTKVFLEIPEPNQESIDLVKQLGLSKMWETFRMYRGPAPNLPLDRIYAVTCLQLG